ncbi:unnamed protein product [Mucor hiemalis]
MKWRVLILVLTGIAMIYFVSLLQDVPYPHPLIIQATTPETARIDEPNQTLLTIHNDYIYRTQIHYKAVHDKNKHFVRGIDPIQTDVRGLIIQSRKKKADLLTKYPEESWEPLSTHVLDGPISKVSKSAEGTEPLQFAVLYHVIEDQDIRHFTRVYYFTFTNGSISSEYKDFMFPGSTMINAISLEQNSIIYARDPDNYRFRIANLPDNISHAPHSQLSTPTLLNIGETGDLARSFDTVIHNAYRATDTYLKDKFDVWLRPTGTDAHIGLLSALYSPNSRTYRAFSLDIDKWDEKYHINITIVDGNKHTNKKPGYQLGQWIYRDHISPPPVNAVIDEGLEYMAFADGAQFHQEKTVIKMPKPSISRSQDGKTVVVSLLKNDFFTMDFTDNLEHIGNDAVKRQRLYKNADGTILNEFYHDMRSTVESNEAAYDPTDIRGIQLNANGSLLAVWTESNSIYIYKRGSLDRTPSNYLLKESPHHLEVQSLWILCMVISPKEGLLGSITPIGASLFWEVDGSNYLSVAMNNNIVNTYLVDETEEQKAVNFQTFMRDRKDMLLVMSMSVIMFAVNEYKTYLV